MLPKNKKPKINPNLYKSNRFTNDELRTVLPDGAWKGKPCFIVGGGPSLEDFDWTLLKGKRTIGINLAYMEFDPTIIFSMDTRFLRWIERGEYGNEARSRLIESTAYKVWLCTYVASLPNFFNIYRVKIYKQDYWTAMRAFTETQKEGLGHGDNSGYAALNLACCLGANPIYLLGFDLKHENGKSHWHKGHIVPQELKKLEGFVPHFEWAAPLIRSRQIKVINLNPDSGLNCFEKMKPEGIL